MRVNINNIEIKCVCYSGGTRSWHANYDFWYKDQKGHVHVEMTKSSDFTPNTKVNVNGGIQWPMFKESWHPHHTKVVKQAIKRQLEHEATFDMAAKQ